MYGLVLPKEQANEVMKYYSFTLATHNNHVIESGFFLTPEPSSDVVWVTHCQTCKQIIGRAFISRKYLKLKGDTFGSEGT